MSKMSVLAEIFGGHSEIARAAGVNRALIVRWAKAGKVPTHYNHKILAASDELGLDRAKVAACLDEHRCPCCGQALEPGQSLNFKSSLVRRAIQSLGKPSDEEHGE